MQIFYFTGRGEENPKLAMEINDTGVRNVFDVAVKHSLRYSTYLL
jgi:hypothetical protein